ncbi:ferredoxin [Chloroflexota bacterium]
MKVKIDRDLCIGVSNCVAIAPTVFKLDDKIKAIVLDSSSVDDDTLSEAAESCPENAVSIEDDEGRLVFTVTAQATSTQGPFYQHVYRADADRTNMTQVVNLESDTTGGFVDIAVSHQRR